MEKQSKNSTAERQSLQELNRYFSRAATWKRGVHFLYVFDILDHQLCYQQGLAEFLGYDLVESPFIHLSLLFHPAEHQKLIRMERRLGELSAICGLGDFELSIVHRMRKADGGYLRIWRRVYPFSEDFTGSKDLYYCLCLDITPFNPTEKMTARIFGLGTHAPEPDWLRDFLIGQSFGREIRFTERQLEVLRIWSETDSPKLAAQKLDIELRTLETHLKNVRKRLGVRRTLDAVLYAREQGWI
ncbi:MAG TPA: helix-turn-helix transcriptional regulator [Flavilitoribacter sp.]|nr:helix-turn-helix transcriptional regulator [Flavilitoribacter sp.]